MADRDYIIKNGETGLHSTLVRFMEGQSAGGGMASSRFTFHSGKIHGWPRLLDSQVKSLFTFHSGKIHGWNVGANKYGYGVYIPLW